MFSNKKSSYPAGTFLPPYIRTIVIVQLSLSFTLFISYIFYPFLGELYEIKKKAAVYEYVTDRNDLIIQKLYSNLPDDIKKMVIHKKNAFLQIQSRPFAEKLQNSFQILFFEIPLFEQLWILCSIIICLLLLLKIEGSRELAWILPAIVLAYSLSLIQNPIEINPSDYKFRYPAEEIIVANYLKKPLSGSIFEQQKQLTEGWHLYLIDVWAKEVPSSDPGTFEIQIKKGQFLFHLSAIKEENPAKKNSLFFYQRPSTTVLLLYFFWNCFFAFSCRKAKSPLDNRLSLPHK